MELLNNVISKKINLGCGDRYDALMDIKKSIDTVGMYEFAKQFRVLVNESAEEFAIQFMSTFNKEVYYWY